MNEMSEKVRVMESCPALVENTFPVDEIDSGAKDAAEWLTQQAAALVTKVGITEWYLLAHADDGVIWGRTENNNLLTSDQAIKDKYATLSPHDAARAEIEAALRTCAPLRRETLQQARLFCEKAELLLWRDGDNRFHARLIRDAQNSEEGEWDDCFDEHQMLWGTHGLHLDSDFTLLRDGAQGLRHAVPLASTLDTEGETTPPRLIVRHYINKQGFARVEASRLIGFGKG